VAADGPPKFSQGAARSGRILSAAEVLVGRKRFEEQDDIVSWAAQMAEWKGSSHPR
jgi:hypothetical protein